LNQWKYTVFSIDGVSGVKNVKYMCSGFCDVSVV